MILHMAIFRWKDGTTDEQIAAATAALHALPAQIAELRAYTAEPNLRVRPGADFGVTAVVDDEAAVNAYLDHPAHTSAVEQFLAPIIAERSAVQIPYELGRPGQ